METARCTATSLPIAEGNNPANVSRPEPELITNPIRRSRGETFVLAYVNRLRDGAQDGRRSAQRFRRRRRTRSANPPASNARVAGSGVGVGVGAERLKERGSILKLGGWVPTTTKSALTVPRPATSMANKSRPPSSSSPTMLPINVNGVLRTCNKTRSQPPGGCLARLLLGD